MAYHYREALEKLVYHGDGIHYEGRFEGSLERHDPGSPKFFYTQKNGGQK